MNSGIYKITNKKNNKCYIGLSKNIDKRKEQHIRGMGDYSATKQLYIIIQEFGVENFTFEILEYCPIHQLGERENYYIKKFDSFKNGYNASWGGEGSESKTIKDKYNLQLKIKINTNGIFNKKRIITDTSNEYIRNNISLKKYISYLEDKIDKYSKKNKKRKVKKIQGKLNLLLSDVENKSNYIDQKINLINEKANSINKNIEYFKNIFNNYVIETNNLKKAFSIKTKEINRDRFQRDNVKYIKISLTDIEDKLIFDWKKIITQSTKWNIKWENLQNIQISLNDYKSGIINLNSFETINKEIGTFRSENSPKISKNKMIIDVNMINLLLILSLITNEIGIYEREIR